MANLALGLDTIPCLLSLWSEWSDCSVTCGKGMRTRQRMLKSLAELGDCNEELEQVEKCMLPECRKSWRSWEPPLLLLTRPARCSYC